MKATAGTLGADIAALVAQEHTGGKRTVSPVQDQFMGMEFNVFNPSQQRGVSSIIAAGPGGSRGGAGVSL